MRPYLLLILSLFFIPTGRPDLTSDRAALEALRKAVGGRSLLWNLSSTTPCSWPGVDCRGDRVVELRLPGMGLTGQIPAGTIGNLTQLRTLSLRFNALSGSIPSDLAAVTGLRNLYLQHNLFSGEIPAVLFSLANLVRLNLAGNNFSGEISPGLNNLTRLATLYMEDNQLTGSIPELTMPLEQFNVSNNQLNGSVPTKFSKMPTSSFEGNSMCGRPLACCPDNCSEGKKKLSGGAIAGIIIGAVLGFLFLLVILFFLCRKRNRGKTSSREIEPVKQSDVEIPGEKSIGGDGFGSGHVAAAVPASAKVEMKNGAKSLVFFGNSPGNFDLEDLLRASAEVLGKGTFGTAYKAALETGLVVAVKRLRDVMVPEKEFREKIQVVGAIDHENLVPPRAYYYSRDEKLLVYDYMPMGSLSALLHSNRGAGRSPLNWETRSSIALGAARGIAHIHSRGTTISHGNIKSSNVLLTKSYEARVSDYGLSQLVGPAATPNRIAGYRAPEVTDPRKVSQKADVYSFGVLLLELLTGKAPSHAILNEEGVDLPRWVMSVVKEEWTSEVFDVELLRYQNVEEEMVELLQLAIDCTAQYPDNRPSMAEVTSQIEQLCRSSRDLVNNPDDGPSDRAYYSVDSVPPHV